MLIGALGIRLILLIGATLPLPAPKRVMTALKRLMITNATDGNDGFEMTFTLGKGKLGDYELLSSGALDPDTRIVIGLLLGASPEPLIDGVIHHHQVAPSREPGMSTLTVKGRDVSIMLDLEEKNDKYENQPDFLIVTRLILKYAQYGLIPKVTPTSDIPIMSTASRANMKPISYSSSVWQSAMASCFIRAAHFGANTAYWGPENRSECRNPP